MKKRKPTIAVVAVAAITLASAMVAATVPLVARTTMLPEPASRDLADAKRVGQGKLTWFGLDVYEAFLYAPQGRYVQGAPVALRLNYLRDLKGEAIAKRSRDEMAKLGVAPAQLDPWMTAMQRVFPDVRKGQALTGVQRADGGVSFYLDDKPLGVVGDPAFGAAFFAIWLDERTSAPGLRQALLGQRK
jgi:hypothetical protein